MSYAHGTSHYNLPQTVGTDKRDWFDTNQAFANVDADLYAAKTGAETAVHDIGVVEASVTALEGRVSTAEGDIDTLEAGLATANENIGINATAITDIRTQLGADKQDLKDAICAIEEDSATAEYRHEVGTFFWYNDTLYKTTVLIPIGQQIVPNVNCSTTNITTELLSGGGSVSADTVSFDNTGTDLSSTNVEDVVKEVNNKLPSGSVIDDTTTSTDSTWSSSKISTPAVGNTRYNTTSNKMEYYNGTQWVEISGGDTMPEMDIANKVTITTTAYTTTKAGCVILNASTSSGATLNIDSLEIRNTSDRSYAQINFIPSGTSISLSGNLTNDVCVFIPYK